MERRPKSEDILNRASGEHITAEELDILVSHSNNISSARERDVNKLQTLLDHIEQKISRS
jgi:hypothetical protein